MSTPGHPDTDYDVVILGAGPVGTTLALFLAGTSHRVLLVEQRSLAAARQDPRALALSEGARQLLEPHAAWPHPGGHGDGRCTPIETIHISQHGGFGRTLIDRRDYRIPALGYVVRYGALLGSLHDALAKSIQRFPAQISLLENTRAEICSRPVRNTSQMSNDSFRRSVQVGEQTLRTRLIVHAEGTPPDDSTDVIARGYGQRALIFEAGLAHSHQQRAWERFTPQGPLALLPVDGVDGKRVSVVYTVPESEADTLLALDDAAILARIQQAMGPHAVFTAVGPRALSAEIAFTPICLSRPGTLDRQRRTNTPSGFRPGIQSRVTRCRPARLSVTGKPGSGLSSYAHTLYTQSTARSLGCSRFYRWHRTCVLDPLSSAQRGTGSRTQRNGSDQSIAPFRSAPDDLGCPRLALNPNEAATHKTD